MKDGHGPWSDTIEAGPLGVNWTHGPVPPVEEVCFNCTIVLWSHDYVGVITPSGNPLNPLRWVDFGGMPRWGYETPVGWWAWGSRGNSIRPANVKTAAEFFADDRARTT